MSVQIHARTHNHRLSSFFDALFLSGKRTCVSSGLSEKSGTCAFDTSELLSSTHKLTCSDDLKENITPGFFCLLSFLSLNRLCSCDQISQRPPQATLPCLILGTTKPLPLALMETKREGCHKMKRIETERGKKKRMMMMMIKDASVFYCFR